MATPTDKREETLRQQQALLGTLKKISPKVYENKLPPQETWPSTRQLVKAHDISIYRARYLLLDMVKKNMIMVSDRNLSHTLRWFPAGKDHIDNVDLLSP